MLLSLNILEPADDAPWTEPGTTQRMLREAPVVRDAAISTPATREPEDFLSVTSDTRLGVLCRICTG